jgi:cytochrome b involved in lipid metabolism
MNKGLLAIPGVIVVIIIAIIVANSSSNSDKCIVTVYGNNYDVTTLRDSHPGGDIYLCGQDMTGMYEGQHGSNIQRLEPYLVP